MSKKIFHSVMAVAMTVLLTSLLFISSFLYEFYNHSQVNRLKEELSLAAMGVEQSGISYFDDYTSNIFRFTMIAKNGSVLYDSKTINTEMENHLDREEIKEASVNGSGSSARYSQTLTERTFYEAIRLKDGNFLRISTTQITFATLMISMSPLICTIIIFAIVFAALLSQSIAKSIVKPLATLDLEKPENNNTYEELEPVLSKLSGQRRQIKSQMEKLQRKSDEFEQIISSMNEGLVLLDNHGMVLSMNTAAKQVFAVTKDVQGSDFLLVDHTTKMSQAIWSALDGEHKEYTEAKNGREYQFTISPIESEHNVLGAVILVFDVSDRIFAERNRQEFTANVTHELKTPLQSIIGSAELLENGLVKPEDTSKFVGNIRKEATRLVSLINDIIRLSQLDENYRPTTEIVNLNEVTREIVEVLTATAAKKNIELRVVGESCSIFSVRNYIYEIIYNLCDNAIRYNVDNGKVIIEIHQNDTQTSISIKDTGIGIAPEHHNRIFERFYCVDKSHSKETGGTGLGLSIVKHAAACLNASISLESNVNAGTTITVIFDTAQK